MWPYPEKGPAPKIGLAAAGAVDPTDPQTIKEGNIVVGLTKQGRPLCREIYGDHVQRGKVLRCEVVQALRRVEVPQVTAHVPDPRVPRVQVWHSYQAQVF